MKLRTRSTLGCSDSVSTVNGAVPTSMPSLSSSSFAFALLAFSFRFFSFLRARFLPAQPH